MHRRGEPTGRAPTDGVATDPAIELVGVGKAYRRGAQLVHALEGVDLTIRTGEMVAVTGPSGAGKSTLLNLLGALDVPTSGTVRMGGVDLGRMDDRAATLHRHRRVGFVFQFFNLLPALRAWENVAVPALLGGGRLRPARARAVALLERVGLGDRVEHRPGELSGGQLQRVALARALFCEPAVILADEPTGNLDSASGKEVLDLLRSVCQVEGGTVVMVTHDAAATSVADRTVRLRDGHVDASAETAGAPG